MNTSNQKEIDRRAGKIFEFKTPDNWILRSQQDQEDYGIDFEVEVTAEGKPTGNIFKVQQKGSIHVPLINQGTTVSHGGLGVERLRYYLFQLEIPTILTVVDISTEQVYWIGLQSNPAIQEKLVEAAAKGTASVTVHIPVENVYPETCDRLLAEVEDIKGHLALRRVMRVPIPNIEALVAEMEDSDRAAQNLRAHLNTVQSRRLEQLMQAGELQKALALALSAFTDAGNEVSARFFYGCMAHVALGVLATSDQNDRQCELWRIQRVAVADRLVSLTWSSRGHLLHHALTLAWSSRLRIKSLTDQALLVSARIQDASEQKDGATLFLTHQQIRLSTEAILAYFRKIQRHLTSILRTGHLENAIDAWNQVTMDMGHFLHTLAGGEQKEGSRYVVRWLDAFGRLCGEIVIKFWPDQEILAKVLLTRVTLARLVEQEKDRIYEEIDQLIAQVKNREQRERVQSIIEEGRRTAAPPKNSATMPTNEEEAINLIKLLARRLGIDADDPRDPLGRIVSIGLRDANPERVLKNCVHLRVALGSSGSLAQMLGLPTAGSKHVLCNEHNYNVSGLSLDDVYAFFAQEHCSTCPDRNPHSQDWKWSAEWQEAHPGFAEDEDIDFGDVDGGDVDGGDVDGD